MDQTKHKDWKVYFLNESQHTAEGASYGKLDVTSIRIRFGMIRTCIADDNVFEQIRIRHRSEQLLL